ncbi:MAG: helix-turn-helix domain-containing protein [Bacteroidales bacterium]|jgi:transcriptional regulator with XRE-family HTH domain|nr:helix-turn-helix domain-containing protein [Bacteroidales bacterium]MCI1785369.1 helix-turn-helix domain-containing protein [Bacteroidales bacterium]
MDNDSVKKNITKVRKNLKFTQQEMADRIGLSRIAYRNIENGRTKLISDNIGKIASVADISKEELVLGYLPVDAESSGLAETKVVYENRIKSLCDEYESRIADLETKLEVDKKMCRAYEDLIKAKDEIINMLNSRILTVPKEKSE